MQIDLTVEFSELRGRLARAGERLDNMTPVYGAIGEYLLKSTKDRFRAGEAPDGSKWEPKRASTIARYLAAKDGNRPRPLIGPSGRLSNEINYLTSRQGVEIGSALEYSGVMQFGAAKGAFGRDSRNRPIPWGTIVPRVWLGLSNTDERNVLQIVDEAIDEAIGQ